MAATGLLISTLVEQGVIDYLAIRLLLAASFHESVFRANYLTLGTALLIAAFKSLPGRLKEPNVLFPQ